VDIRVNPWQYFSIWGLGFGKKNNFFGLCVGLCVLCVLCGSIFFWEVVAGGLTLK